jgi:hypothetical protein
MATSLLAELGDGTDAIVGQRKAARPGARQAGAIDSFMVM